MVRRWRSWFLEGRQNLHDDERSGRPVTATDNAAVAAVQNVMEADRRVTIDEIMIRLTPGIEIGRSSIGTIMSDVLNFRKLEMHRRDGDQLFSPIVTGDEIWVHQSTPETKRQSMMWKKPEEGVPKKGEVHNLCRQSYGYRLLGLTAIKRKHPGPWSRKVLLVHDNARPHAARTTQTLLENFKWEIFTHPTYSPELAPSDFHLFPALKLHLGGKHFANDDEVQAEANHWLRRQDTAWYNSDIFLQPLPVSFAQQLPDPSLQPLPIPTKQQLLVPCLHPLPMPNNRQLPVPLLPILPGRPTRLCIDFRNLNLITKTENAPILLIEEILDRLGNAEMSTSLDIKHAYWILQEATRPQLITESRQDDHNEDDHNEEGKKTVQIEKREEQRWRNQPASPTKRPSNLPPNDTAENPAK
ncbi:hypothetical protein LAZ67_8001474 [Cordylochernes scorpioides]|uniref:Transposase n=1 Tax=Cordylochernes scorpioides TaxID=51811 RepID=A0ABY6KRU4_9ARAC|nr:hypothetical protein LAZ67_8001474 [Cordylochernes scorpioides]